MLSHNLKTLGLRITFVHPETSGTSKGGLRVAGSIDSGAILPTANHVTLASVYPPED